jgi:hypothetical protein
MKLTIVAHTASAAGQSSTAAAILEVGQARDEEILGTEPTIARRGSPMNLTSTLCIKQEDKRANWRPLDSWYRGLGDPRRPPLRYLQLA